MFDYEVVPDDSLTSADDSGLSVRGRRSEALQPAEVEDRKGVEIRDIDTVLHMTAVIGDPVRNGEHVVGSELTDPQTTTSISRRKVSHNALSFRAGDAACLVRQ
jgi:hypothetical protein